MNRYLDMFSVFAIMAYEIGIISAIEWRRNILLTRKKNLRTFDKKITKAYHYQATMRKNN